MSAPFPYGPYKIINFENGDINILPIKLVIIPVVATPEAAPEITPTAPQKLAFNVNNLVNILKDAQPANLERPITDHVPGDKGIVAINVGAAPSS
ncbi:hypothetical protein Clacol_010245 [Clathrus columnatus]|uniref:Uncharacterized protein n=1 Tax=Clathrus columnatus TaxID=1419009 RepID=A0AAV5AUH9_9AGAM|nr:hypothetical protein Clacol_010245 [Clathrus columnatus]